MNEQQEIDSVEQHKKDARKALAVLETEKCNIVGSNNTWEEIKQIRKKHIESFIESLEIQEKQFEHFK